MTLLIIFIIIFVGRSNCSIFGYEFLNTDEFVIGAKSMRLIDGFSITQFDGDTSGILNSINSINSPFFKSVSNIPLKNLSAGIFLLVV